MTDFLNFAQYLGPDAGGIVYILELLLRVTAILFVAMLAILVLRRSSASLRHSVWALTLVGTLLLPFFYAMFPAWQWAILPGQPQVSSSTIASIAKATPSEVPVPSTPLHSFSEVTAAPPQGYEAPQTEIALSKEISPVVIEPTSPSVASSVPILPESTWSWPRFFCRDLECGHILGTYLAGDRHRGSLACFSTCEADNRFELVADFTATCRVVRFSSPDFHTRVDRRVGSNDLGFVSTGDSDSCRQWQLV